MAGSLPPLSQLELARQRAQLAAAGTARSMAQVRASEEAAREEAKDLRAEQKDLRTRQLQALSERTQAQAPSPEEREKQAEARLTSREKKIEQRFPGEEAYRVEGEKRSRVYKPTSRKARSVAAEQVGTSAFGEADTRAEVIQRVQARRQEGRQQATKARGADDVSSVQFGQPATPIKVR